VHILFFSHYFPPEVNAPASRTFEHCLRWLRAGHDVTVVTCQPNCPDGVVYSGYKNGFRSRVETVEGVRVIRVWTYLAPNAGTVRRTLNYLSYMISATLRAIRLPRPDVVVATSPQFFCGWAGVFTSWLKRVPLVLEVRDLWPESIRAVGAIRSRWLLRILERLERWMYRAAAHIVTVGNGYRDKILAKGPGPEHVSVITNGVDLEFFVPREPDVPFLHTWELEDKFVCSYVGTIGMAHGLEVVLDAAEILKQSGRRDIRFCLVGDGAARRQLEREAQRRGLSEMVVFVGRQPKETVPAILAGSDACLIHLRGCELFGTVLPSKIFETMAMGRPIILGVEGEARQIVMQAGAGVAMEPDSAESLVQAVLALADNPDSASERARAARDYVRKHFDRNVLASRFLRLLHEVVGIEETKAGPAAATSVEETSQRVDSAESTCNVPGRASRH